MELQHQIKEIHSRIEVVNRSKQLADAQLYFSIRSVDFAQQSAKFKKIGLVGLAKKRLHQSLISMMAAERMQRLQHKHFKANYPNL